MRVDLGQHPRERWILTPQEAASACELLQTYRADLDFDASAAARLCAFARPLIPTDYWQELESLAACIGMPLEDIAVCNLYYDALKVLLDDTGRQLLGCTAFAYEHPDGSIVHARNLDWYGVLSGIARADSRSH